MKETKERALEVCKKLAIEFIECECWRLAYDILEVATAIDIPDIYNIKRDNFIFEENDFKVGEKEILNGAIKKLNVRIV